MTGRCGHVLLKVVDLHAAVRDFRALGFTVTYGADPATSRNAHVWFPEGPIIEILTTPPGARLLRWPLDLALGRGSGVRMTRWARAAEGFCDVAVLVDELDTTLTALRAAGVPSGKAVRWTRTRPDGVPVRFRFAYPCNDRLPFLVTPYDPPQHPPDAAHANGATRIAAVGVGVAPADRAAVERLTGADPTFRRTEAPVTAVQWVELAGLDGVLDPALLHGARIH